MAPAASPSWALVDGDEVGTTIAPAMLRTAGQNVVTLQPASKARIRSLQRDQIYVYLREGALSFDAKNRGIAICAADRLYIPEPLAKGVVVLDKSGQVTRSLKSGSFAEDGVRGCGETGIAGVLSSLPVSAAAGSSATGVAAAAGGSAIGAGAGAAGAGAAGAAATAAAAVGVGSAAAIGVASGASASTSSGCTSAAGCNSNPPSVSPSTP